MRILIADDDKIALTLLNFTLKAVGHEVLTAVNGRLALDSLRATDCKLLITDWEMPEMDGLALCKAVRADPALAGVYLILLSGHNSQDRKDAARAAGADDFLVKPFEPNLLKARIAAAQSALALKA